MAGAAVTYNVIQTRAEAIAEVKRLRAEAVVYFDCEMVHVGNQPQVALVQACADTGPVCLFDCTSNISGSGILDLLKDEKITKVTWRLICLLFWGGFFLMVLLLLCVRVCVRACVRVRLLFGGLCCYLKQNNNLVFLNKINTTTAVVAFNITVYLKAFLTYVYGVLRGVI